MVVGLQHLQTIVSEMMDHYWRVVLSPTDEGLDAEELSWKRAHEEDMARMEKKFGADFDAYFGVKK